ncbi:hypothetical protein G5B40_03740 [Pikeienuella piscinae]|uniref:Uncharacterized protein n=1 Tax=Pikeienuella piscinae TaxID=2748098 RepID=A0A7L5BVT6_9RHOB|nr:hypothetical protein [Pikeienuella piscinae]QIE54627.1 hypothetical protein G5B40_03740 [Pikeienuella piscinae]
MTHVHVNTIFGDPATKLPEGLRPADHWAKEPLKSPLDPDPEYDAWIAAGAPPGKPVAG